MPTYVAIGSGTLGGGQNAVGTAIAKVVSDHTPIKVTVKPFAGPAAWMPMVESGELEFGVISGPDAGWAYNGTSGHPKANKNLRVVMSGNQLPVTVLVVRADSDVKPIKEVQPVHAWTKGWKQATMFDPAPAIPYHEGAVRFWKEIGKWTPQTEAIQKKLLGQ
ncbi:MAG: hypothetical protein M1358_14580 [Chloroflexi bacterium]|nr:hypothetical protein [Chloroflexota bacterium]